MESQETAPHPWTMALERRYFFTVDGEGIGNLEDPPVSEFEYLTILLSIIFGLAIAHLLRGVGEAMHQRRRQWDIVHSLWVTNAFLLLAVNWWVTFKFEVYAEEYEAAARGAGVPNPEFWTIDIFLILLLWAVFLYMPSVLLFPPDQGKDEGYNETFHRNRFWLMGTWIAWAFMDVAQTGTRHALFRPWYYLPFLAHWVVLFLIAMFVRKRWVQKTVAFWILFSLLAWTFGVRRILIEI